MKASEALKKPGDVARRESDGAVAVRAESDPDYPARARLVGDSVGYDFCSIHRLSGDDWEPMGVTCEYCQQALREENARLRDEVDAARTLLAVAQQGRDKLAAENADLLRALGVENESEGV